MCALLSAWLYLLLGLLPLEIQSRALTLQSISDRHRTSKFPKSSSSATILPTASDLSVATDNNHITTHGERQIMWRSLLHIEPPPPRLPDMLLLDQSNDSRVLQEAQMWQRGSRGRRHANMRGHHHHGHLMRAGCVLGTCQVQNLSHRLYQLIGQSGREDSSPINPRSPHSYG